MDVVGHHCYAAYCTAVYDIRGTITEYCGGSHLDVKLHPI